MGRTFQVEGRACVKLGGGERGTLEGQKGSQHAWSVVSRSGCGEDPAKPHRAVMCRALGAYSESKKQGGSDMIRYDSRR